MEQGLSLPANVAMPPVSATNSAKSRWQTAATSARFALRHHQKTSLRVKTSRPTLSSTSQNPSFSKTFEGYANVVTCYQALVVAFKSFLLPLQAAEASVLVDVLHAPERLFPVGSELREKCEGGGVVAKLIQHCKLLLVHNQEGLCVRVLQTLCRMATSGKQNFHPQ
uniref:Uncharacterized protein n=1 Tax=Plectus sambesii TaxID=2011161 RepID=A0A914UXI8_9BILA